MTMGDICLRCGKRPKIRGRHYCKMCIEARRVTNSGNPKYQAAYDQPIYRQTSDGHWRRED